MIIMTNTSKHILSGMDETWRTRAQVAVAVADRQVGPNKKRKIGLLYSFSNEHKIRIKLRKIVRCVRKYDFFWR
jgi:hypothetical protein